MHAVHQQRLPDGVRARARKDFTRTISVTVAMGLDNDCTAATAGSLLGAVLGTTAFLNTGGNGTESGLPNHAPNSNSTCTA